MRLKAGIIAGLGLMVPGAAPALADGPKIYACPSAENYCPAGLQPITISGVICCGVPNQSMTYQQVMATPQRSYRKLHRPAPARVSCPVGTKGCTYD